VLDKSSRHFLYANGFLLMTITFMPFSTALLGEYIGTDYVKPAIAFYCFGGVVNSAGWYLLLSTLYKPVLLINKDINRDMVDGVKRSTLWGMFVYIGCTALAFWLPIVALIINLLLWIVWITLSYNAKTN
jgi:uncharacterized membrane protein